MPFVLPSLTSAEPLTNKITGARPISALTEFVPLTSPIATPTFGLRLVEAVLDSALGEALAANGQQMPRLERDADT
jgi:hypothetical protein